MFQEVGDLKDMIELGKRKRTRSKNKKMITTKESGIVFQHIDMKLLEEQIELYGVVLSWGGRYEKENSRINNSTPTKLVSC